MLHPSSEQFKPAPIPAIIVDADEARGLAEAEALIGQDCVKGLQELRRIDAEGRAIFAIESRIHDELMEGLDDAEADVVIAAERSSEAYQSAKRDADGAGERYCYTLAYLWRLPIRTLAEVEAKARLAVEHGSYDPDEFPGETILEQIVEFFNTRAGSPT